MSLSILFIDTEVSPNKVTQIDLHMAPSAVFTYVDKNQIFVPVIL